MPILNNTTSQDLHIKLVTADGPLARLAGLAGTPPAKNRIGYYIDNCRSVHTFGMQYAIDIVFLDKNHQVLEVLRELPPNRATRIRKRARAVLELPAGLLRGKILPGDSLNLKIDEACSLAWRGLASFLHWPMNIMMALLWANFALTSFVHLQNSVSPLNLGVLVINTMLLALFLTRRESKEISRHPVDWLVPIMTVGCSMLLQPVSTAQPIQLSVSLVLQGIGMLAILCSLFNLGRSFGVIPANRQIKVAGIYRVVRHPLYMSEMIFYLGFLLGSPTAWNALMVSLILIGQIYRCFSEEALLLKDQAYLSYKEHVKYRLVPGLF